VGFVILSNALVSAPRFATGKVPIRCSTLLVALQRNEEGVLMKI